MGLRVVLHSPDRADIKSQKTDLDSYLTRCTRDLAGANAPGFSLIVRVDNTPTSARREQRKANLPRDLTTS